MSKVNLSQKVTDEMIIYIPEFGEEVEPIFLTQTTNSGQEGKVDLNKADSAQLETLPGIGPGKAQAIIEYRDMNGPFKTIEDVKNVSGIGEKTFEKLKDHITVK